MFSIFINMKRYITIILLLITTSITGQYLDLDGSSNCAHELITYHDNGNIEEIGCLNDQKRKIGSWSHYNVNGKKIAGIGFDSQGKRHGQWLIWDDNGILRAQMEYRHGTRIGKWSVWNTSGDLINQRTY